MIIEDKIDQLSKAADKELEGRAGKGKIGPKGVFYASCGGKSYFPMLRVLTSNKCKNNCYYCQWRSNLDIPRGDISPEDLSNYFFLLYKKRMIQGAFLSSAVWKSADSSMNNLIDTATILRKKGFDGYIHLKIIPGASKSAIEAAVNVASRVSLNLEAPSAEHLNKIAPEKNYIDELYFTLNLINELKQNTGKYILKNGITTQFVIGPSKESDMDLLKVTNSLYKKDWIRRAYYSPFSSPDNFSPLANIPPTPMLRIHRLYQADWLLRFYQFDITDIPTDNNGFLIIDKDPKKIWADSNLNLFPIEINKAPYELLLRIPGIGPKSVKEIIKLRKESRIKDPMTLKNITNKWKHSLEYLLFDGKHIKQTKQLSLF